MKQELIKKVIKVGNSAGVILPLNWINGRARVELIEKPSDIKKEIFEILDEYLENIKGIYIAGSYARGEEEDRSDIDVLVVTNNINKRIDIGRYNIILMAEEDVRENLSRNIIPLLPMLKEAKSILDSALEVNKKFIELARENGWKLGDAIAYSLILNLRIVYTIDCLKAGKVCKKSQLVSLAKKISGDRK